MVLTGNIMHDIWLTNIMIIMIIHACIFVILHVFEYEACTRGGSGRAKGLCLHPPPLANGAPLKAQCYASSSLPLQHGLSHSPRELQILIWLYQFT